MLNAAICFETNDWQIIKIHLHIWAHFYCVWGEIIYPFLNFNGVTVEV